MALSSSMITSESATIEKLDAKAAAEQQATDGSKEPHPVRFPNFGLLRSSRFTPFWSPICKPSDPTTIYTLDYLAEFGLRLLCCINKHGATGSKASLLSSFNVCAFSCGICGPLPYLSVWSFSWNPCCCCKTQLRMALGFQLLHPETTLAARLLAKDRERDLSPCMWQFPKIWSKQGDQ